MKRLIIIITILSFISIAYADIQTGINLFNQGQYDKAIAALLPYVQQGSNDKRVYWTLFMISSKRNDYNSSVKYGELFLKYGKDYAVAYKLSELYYIHKNYPKVITLSRYININFGDKHEIYNLMGMAYFYSKNYNLAKIALKMANTLHPNQYLYRNNFGRALEKLGNLKGAIIQYRRSVQLNPRYAPAVANLKRITLILSRQRSQ